MTRLFIVRHGNTFAPGDPPRRIGARTDLPLVASGITQAVAVGRAFRRDGIDFAAALCGPLLRTRQTAEAILAQQGQPPALTIVDWLKEIDHGVDEGRPEEEVVARLGPSALAAWERAGVVPDSWATDAAAGIAAWRSLLAAPPPGDVLVVTSNGTARFARLALDRPGDAPLKLRTGAWGVIESYRAGRDRPWRLGAWDRRP